MTETDTEHVTGDCYAREMLAEAASLAENPDATEYIRAAIRALDHDKARESDTHR